MSTANSDKSYSRVLSGAKELASESEAADKLRFLDKRILVTGESPVLSTPNGRECFLDSLRLSSKICRNVSVYIPSDLETLRKEVSSLASGIAFGGPISMLPDSPSYDNFNAILNVGFTVRSDVPNTTINSQGWVARVSSVDKPLRSECDRWNPIAALAASSLGVADVFKRLIKVPESRAKFFNGLSFSVFSYSIQETDDGPVLPSLLDAGVAALIGAGALGNAIAHLLSKLPFAGEVTIIDNQSFEDENLSTCFLIGPKDRSKSKAEFAANTIRRKGLITKFFNGDINDFVRGIGSEYKWPHIVINGLDNIPARHVSQNIWPDLLIDGAVGNFICQASCHPRNQNIACLKCLYREGDGEHAEKTQSRVTGLGLDRLSNPFNTVTQEDVEKAPVEKQAFLGNNIGHQICSVIEVAMAQAISEGRINHPVAVPFVACFAGSMEMAELVKAIMKMPTNLVPRFELDVLVGPAQGLFFPQERRQDCVCVERRDNISSFRAQFSAK